MYRIPHYSKSLISVQNTTEGETIENKVKRLLMNKEPIKDGSPLIYTERSKGVEPAYNVRTDRFEIATDAMDKVHKSKTAKKDDVIKGAENKDEKEAKIVDINKNKNKDSGAESIPGKTESK